jgi:TPR repeat protein
MMMTCLHRRNKTDLIGMHSATIAFPLCRFILLYVIALGITGPTCPKSLAETPLPVSAFDQFVNSGRKALVDGKLDDGIIAAFAAIKENDQSFEGYALAALLLEKQGNTAEALAYLEKALARATEGKKGQLQQIKQRLHPSSQLSNHSVEHRPTKKSSGDAPRNYEAIMLIVEHADKAKDPNERTRMLRQFMRESAEFLESASAHTNVWVIRAASALELDYPGAGWLAGKRLKELGLENSDQAINRKLFAALEQKGWLGNKRPARDWRKWTNEQMLEAARNGDEEAQVALGVWYRNGYGFAKNELEAVNWFRKAAHQGNEDAKWFLAQMETPSSHPNDDRQ